MTKLKQSWKKKIQFWESRVTKEITECFPKFHDFLSESETPLSSEIASELTEHLKNLQMSIRKYFPSAKTRGELGQKSILSLYRGFWPTTQRSWTAYQHSGWQKPNRHFKTVTLRSEYPEIVKYSRQHLISFVSIYHCETAVLKYAVTKSKQRSRLDPEAVIQYQTWLQKLISGKQTHPSHLLHAHFNGKSKTKDQF